MVSVVATDEWSEVTLLTEELENVEHTRPPSHNVVVYPRKRWMPAALTFALVGLLPVFVPGHPCGDIITVCVAVGCIRGGKMRSVGVVTVLTVGGGSVRIVHGQDPGVLGDRGGTWRFHSCGRDPVNRLSCSA